MTFFLSITITVVRYLHRVIASMFFFSFSSSFLRFFVSMICNQIFNSSRLVFLFFIYFAISQLLLVNTWKSYRIRGDNHFNGIDNLIRFEWKDEDIYIYTCYIFSVRMNNLKIKYYRVNEFPYVILQITIKNSKYATQYARYL